MTGRAASAPPRYAAPPRGMKRIVETPCSNPHVSGAGQLLAQLFRAELMRSFAAVPRPVAPQREVDDAA